MGRRGGGGLRGGGGRIGGSLGGGRGGSVGGLGGSLGGAGRRGTLPGAGSGRSGLGGGLRAPAPRAPVARPPASRAGSFGAGVGVGMGMGMMAGGGRRRRRGWGGGWGGGWGRRRRMPMGVHHHHHHHGGGMGMGPRRGGGGCGSGCTSILLMVVVVILIFSVISWMGNFTTPQNWGGQGIDRTVDIPQSTVTRTALPRNAARDIGPLFTDNLDWIGASSQLEPGLRNFHQQTGVRPHLYLVGDINGNRTPTDNQILEYSQDLYDELFAGDEAHVLVLFFENDAPTPLIRIAIIPGLQAESVLDQEAQDILRRSIFHYYYMHDLTEEQVFSRGFNTAAERIMYTPPDNRGVWMTVIIVAGVLLLVFLLFRWWQKKQEQKNLEAEHLERVLNQPLETLGTTVSDEATSLAQQYTEPPDNNNQ